MDENPFERYGLDPRDGVVAITERLKELAEDAKTETERNEIRAAWEELTLHPARRLRAALNAHPETRAPLGAAPLPPRVRVLPTELQLRDLAARPSALAALSVSLVGLASSRGRREPGLASSRGRREPGLASSRGRREPGPELRAVGDAPTPPLDEDSAPLTVERLLR